MLKRKREREREISLRCEREREPAESALRRHFKWKTFCFWGFYYVRARGRKRMYFHFDCFYFRVSRSVCKRDGAMWCKCGRLIAQLEIAAFCQFQPLRAVGGSRVLGEGGGGGVQHLGLWSTLAPGWLCLLMPGLSKALLVQPVCEISIPAGRQLDKIPDDDDFQRKWKLFR